MRCPSCNGKLKDNGNFIYICPKCGKKYRGHAIEVEERTGAKLPVILAAGIGVVLLVVCALFFLFHLNDANSMSLDNDSIAEEEYVSDADISIDVGKEVSTVADSPKSTSVPSLNPAATPIPTPTIIPDSGKDEMEEEPPEPNYGNIEEIEQEISQEEELVPEPAEPLPEMPETTAEPQVEATPEIPENTEKNENVGVPENNLRVYGTPSKSVKGHIQGNFYTDGYASQAEINDVIANYNKIPANIRVALESYGFPIHINGNNANTVLSTQIAARSGGKNTNYATALQLYPWLSKVPGAKDKYYLYQGYLVENNPYDVNNVMFINVDGNPYCVSHGFLIPVTDTSAVTLQRCKDIYLSTASEFGETIVQSLASEPEETINVARAESEGPTCVYDDTTFAFQYVQNPGYIEYYANAMAYTPDTIIHEVGHMVDWYSVPRSGAYRGTLFGLSGTETWNSLYQASKAGMAQMDVLAATNVPLGADEGFAEAFRLVILYPDRMVAQFPGVYQYLNQIISTF